MFAIKTRGIIAFDRLDAYFIDCIVGMSFTKKTFTVVL